MQALLRGAGALRPRGRQRCIASDADAPLRGTVVVELASVLAGPSVGQFLAEMGARVIKVESPHTGGDVTRGWRAPGEPEDVDGRVSSYFSCCNWGKESIAVDLRHEEGKALVHRLAARADIVLSSFKPGDAAKFELAPGQLLRDNPGLIVADITGYGLREHRAAYDAVIQAEVGFFHLNGQSDGPPTKLPVALMDVLAAHQLKEAILLRLLARERSGRGGHVTVSLARAGVAGLANQALNWLRANFRPGRMGSAHPNICPYGDVLRTGCGGELVLAVGADAQFAALCSVLGDEELASDASGYRRNADRVPRRLELMAALGELAQRWTAADLVAALRAVSVPCGRVNAVEQAFDEPFAQPMVLGGGAGDASRNAGGGSAAAVGLRQTAFACGDGEALNADDRVTGAASVHLAPPPGYSQHTSAVLEWLGCDRAQQAALRESGAVEG